MRSCCYGKTGRLEKAKRRQFNDDTEHDSQRLEDLAENPLAMRRAENDAAALKPRQRWLAM